jgi:3'-5' exoribonuclease
MKSPFVNELEPSKIATAVFLVQSKEVRQKKTGEPYLSLLLCDRTGEVDAKMWDNVAEVMTAFERDDFVRAKGVLQIYNNRPQFTVYKVQRVEESEVDLADFLPASQRDPREMLAELRGIVGGIGNVHLRGLLEAALSDEDVAARLLKAPAAKFIHHAFLGGLLEHILSLCKMCRLAVENYPAMDLDLLLTGAVLHDIGKIYELSYERSFGYTSEGQLLGHITIGLRLVDRKLAQMPEFPPRLRALVEHLVLSHHGALEFGSPKLPMFPEAMLLHYLDDLDAKIECMRTLVENDRQAASYFTPYNNQLERVVLKKRKFLEEGVADESDPPAPPAAVAEAVAASGGGKTRAVRPVAPTLFAEKLGQALGTTEK